MILPITSTSAEVSSAQKMTDRRGSSSIWANFFPVQPAAEIPNQIADREPNIDKQILNQNVCKWRLGAPFDGKLLKRFHSRAPCGHAFSKLMSFIGILLWATTAIPQNQKFFSFEE